MAATVLISALEKLTDSLKTATEVFNQGQKYSLALGKEFEQVNKSLIPTMQGLRGDLRSQFEAGMAGMIAGLQGNTAGIAKLINQQKLTGTEYKNTADSFASLEASLNLSRDRTNLLAENLILTGNRWEISTDKLVDAVNALKDTFPAQALAGYGDTVMAAVANIQATLGPQLQRQLTSVMNIILDTSMQGLERINLLGLTGVREQLSTASTVQEAVFILEKAFNTASERFKTIASGADKSFERIGIAQEVFGKEAILFTTIANNLGKRIDTQASQMVDYGRQFEVLLREILVPFQRALFNFMPTVLDALDNFTAISAIFAREFENFLGTLPTGREAVKQLSLRFIDFSIFLVEEVPRTFNKLSNRIDKFIFDTFETGGSFYKMVTAIYEFKAAVAETIIGIKDYLPLIEPSQSDINRYSEELATLVERQVMQDKAPTWFTRQLEIAAEEERAGLLTGPARSETARNIIASLNAVKASIEGDQIVYREGNDYLRESRNSLKSIDNKTPDNTTMSTFLTETTSTLSLAMERILGVGPKASMDDLISAIEDQTGVIIQTSQTEPRGFLESLPVNS